MFQSQSTLRRVEAEKLRLMEEMKETQDRKESVSQWEGQISEIIQWWVKFRNMSPYSGKLKLGNQRSQRSELKLFTWDFIALQ